MKFRPSPKSLAIMGMALAMLIGGCSGSKLALNANKKGEERPGRKQAFPAPDIPFPEDPPLQGGLNPLMASQDQTLPETYPTQPHEGGQGSRVDLGGATGETKGAEVLLSNPGNEPIEPPPPVSPFLDPTKENPEPQESPSLVSPGDVEVIERAAEEEIPLPEPPLAEYDFPIEFNEKVKAYIHHFQTARRGLLERAFQRAARYRPLIREIFQEKGLPLDLINLAFIESAFNPYAYSRAGAAGIWQLMEATGRLLGLRTDWWLDERRDPEKATLAAAKYLGALYDLFKSWPLAIAAYNAGDGTILRALKRSGVADFWSLRLPLETQLFVPAFMAITVIVKNPELYGFTVPQDEPLRYEKVYLEDATDLRLLAQAAGVSLEEIRELNPELSRFATPPHYPGYQLKLPWGTREAFLENLDRIPREKRVSWLRHRISKGETLSKIAKRYGAPVKVLMELNGLQGRALIRAGSHLLIPVPYGFTLTMAPPPEKVRPNVSARKARPKARHPKEIKYVVKRGDTLWRIAKEFSVPLGELRRWNGLSPKAVLKPGLELKIWVD